jgi:hypothetical protein
MENTCMVIKQNKKKEKRENAYHTETTNIKIKSFDDGDTV